MLKYTFRNEALYIEAWTYLMRLGMGFKYNRDALEIRVDPAADEFGDASAIKRRLDDIASE